MEEEHGPAMEDSDAEILSLPPEWLFFSSTCMLHTILN
jgi:hypothetical protein